MIFQTIDHVQTVLHWRHYKNTDTHIVTLIITNTQAHYTILMLQNDSPKARSANTI